MVSLRKIRLCCAPVARLLICTVLLLSLAPHHYHLHHGTGPDSVAHAHTIDLHLLSDNSDEAHHEDAIVLEITPDGLLKPLGDNPSNLLFILCLLTLLPILASGLRQPFRETRLRLRQVLYHLIPPQRAPPRRALN